MLFNAALITCENNYLYKKANIMKQERLTKNFIVNFMRLRYLTIIS